MDAKVVLERYLRPGVSAPTVRFSARHRLDGRDIYHRVVSILTGSSIRAVKQATRSFWENLGSHGKDSWAQLHELFKLSDVQPCAQEFLPDWSLKRRHVSDERRTRAAAADSATWHGYGISVVFNTPVGQDDVEVIRILQSGKSGQELRTELKKVPCYKVFLDACWEHFEEVGKENGFPLVACGLEHSEHGSHPARVHVHVFMGMDVRGAFFANNAPMGVISHEKLVWGGQEPGYVRPTLVVRRTHSHIHKAVIQAYYYVAGPKSTQLLLRCSATLHTEKRPTVSGS